MAPWTRSPVVIVFPIRCARTVPPCRRRVEGSTAWSDYRGPGLLVGAARRELERCRRRHARAARRGLSPVARRSAGGMTNPFSEVRGGLVIEWRLACDGWLSRQRLAFVGTLQEGGDLGHDVRFSSWEALDGSRMRYSYRSYDDRRAAGGVPRRSRARAARRAAWPPSPRRASAGSICRPARCFRPMHMQAGPGRSASPASSSSVTRCSTAPGSIR